MNGASVQDHEGFTKMLFVDALCGLGACGMPRAARQEAVKQGLMKSTGSQYNEKWDWKRGALEELPISDLQDLYVGLKYQEVTHAS